MKLGRGVKLAVVAVVALAFGLSAAAKDPIFLRWLIDDDPGDETIRVYWQRAEEGELDPAGLVDLGTMLFYRGYPKDAVRLFRQALNRDPKLYEAWFRIGLVEHREGNLGDAEVAYRKCLKLLTGHGWCNFYLGLLCEHTDRPSKALYYFRRAFKFAPELADAGVNPELTRSDLALGAIVRQRERTRFTRTMPMPFLQPDEVKAVRQSFEPPVEPEDVNALRKPGWDEPPPPPLPDEVKKVEEGAEKPSPWGVAAPPEAPVTRPQAGRERGPRPTPSPPPEKPPSEGGQGLVPAVSPEASLPPLDNPFQRAENPSASS